MNCDYCEQPLTDDTVKHYSHVFHKKCWRKTRRQAVAWLKGKLVIDNAIVEKALSQKHG